MFIKNKILFLILFISPLVSFSQVEEKEIRNDSSEKNLMGSIRTSIAVPNMETNNSSATSPFVSVELNGRYAFGEIFGVTLGFEKWVGGSEISTQSGNLAYRFHFGGIVAFSGSLSDKNKIILKIFDKDPYKVLRRTKVQNKFDGFRGELFLTEFNFSEQLASGIGIGGSLFYEQRWKDNYFLQYGTKGNYLSNDKLEISLFQIFLGLGF